MSIDSIERITRRLNIQLQEAKEARNLCSKLPRRTRSKAQVNDDEIVRLDSSIRELRRQAATVGIVEKFDRKGLFLGFGNGLPPIATRVESTLGAYGTNSFTYPLLSAAAHGTSWAAAALASQNESGYPPHEFADLVLKRVEWLIVMTTQWVARSAWLHHAQFGWNLTEIKTTLEHEYDQLGLKPDTRFWR